MKKNVHRAGKLRDFLKAEGALAEAEERAMKQMLMLRTTTGRERGGHPSRSAAFLCFLTPFIS